MADRVLRQPEQDRLANGRHEDRHRALGARAIHHFADLPDLLFGIVVGRVYVDEKRVPPRGREAVAALEILVVVRLVDQEDSRCCVAACQLHRTVCHGRLPALRKRPLTLSHAALALTGMGIALTNPPMPLSEPVREHLSTLIGSHRVVLFMKGNRRFPQCGFSAQVVEILNQLIPSFERTVNVLADPAVRDEE